MLLRSCGAQHHPKLLRKHRYVTFPINLFSRIKKKKEEVWKCSDEIDKQKTVQQDNLHGRWCTEIKPCNFCHPMSKGKLNEMLGSGGGG